MRIGLIARCDNGGLGIQTLDFYRHMKPTKTAVIKIGSYEQFPERYPGAQIFDGGMSYGQMHEFCRGIDVLWTIETPYDWQLFKIAKSNGVKTVLQINYEWTPCSIPVEADLYICPADWNLWSSPTPHIHIPNPVDTDHFEYRERQTAKTFVHIAGHQGGYGRNGTVELLKAIPLVKNPDARFIVYSQLPIEGKMDERIKDDRLEVRLTDVDDRRDLFAEADVMVYPRKYAGLSLQLDEALSCGVPTLMTDMDPQNKFLPANWLIKPDNIGEIRIQRVIDKAEIEPSAIAAKIDDFAGRDIRVDSGAARRIAEARSWNIIKPRYLEVLANLTA